MKSEIEKLKEEFTSNIESLANQARNNGYLGALIDVRHHLLSQLRKIELNTPNLEERRKKSQDYLDILQFITNIAEVKHINLN